MKQNCLLLLLFFSTVLLRAQEAPNKYTFTSMVDLYEFPQTEATGGVDVQLPLYKIATRGFEMPVALAYDMMGNTNTFYIGSQFGDAWNLNAIGTISREITDRSYTYSTKTTGSNCGGNQIIIQYTTETLKKNYDVPDENYYYNNPGASYRDNRDLYTFSFLGLSGKFILYNQNNQLKAEVYESSDFVKIEIEQPDWGALITAISIYDKNGYRYRFAAQSNISHNESYEQTYLTEPATLYENCNFEIATGHVLHPGNGHTGTKVFPAGHLISGKMHANGFRYWKNLEISEIYDRHNNLLVSYEYEQLSVTIPDRENRWMNGLGLVKGYTKLYVKNIRIHGQGTLSFSNTLAASNPGALVNSFTNAMEIKDLQGNLIKKIAFDYQTANISNLHIIKPETDIPANKRFYKKLLKGIKEYDNTQQKSLDTAIEYKDNASSGFIIDGFGFLSGYYGCRDYVHPSTYKTDYYTLQKIKYPTGGSVVYKFEPHTFSKGLNWQENEFKMFNSDNHVYEPIALTQVNGQTFQFTANAGDKIFLINKYPGNVLQFYKGTTLAASDLLINAVKAPSGSASFEMACKGALSNIVLPAAPNNQYTLRYTGAGASPYYLAAYKFRYSDTYYAFRYETGMRIAQMAYFKDNVAKNILDTPSGANTAEKLINFTYPGSTPNSSSGHVSLSYYSYFDAAPNNLVYDRVDVEVRGIGKTSLYYDIPASFVKLKRTDLKRSAVFSASGELLSESDYEYEYGKPAINGYVDDTDIKPHIRSVVTRTRQYENGDDAIQSISRTRYDDELRQVEYTSTEEPLLARSQQVNMKYDQINNTIVTTSQQQLINDVMRERTLYSYDTAANLLKTQFGTPEVAPEKIGVENTHYTAGLLTGYIDAAGLPVTLVYGYNSSRIVAKLVNVEASLYYSNNTVYLGSRINIGNYSNQTATTYNETNLKNALNSLRTLFPEAMVTTYTYRPMVGIASITDAAGREERYQYDTFNRLYQVVNHEGLVTQRYQYNYKN